MNLIRIIKTTKFQLLFIIIVTFFAYSNSLGNGLVWDDHLFVEKWKDIQTFSNISNLLGGSTAQAQGGVYRPLRSIFYVFDYGLWGQNPFFYHLQAILIHLVTTVLIYFIIQIITKKKSIAFTSSLLFGLHPIHTETIDYVAASMETFGSMFFFLSFFLYLKKKYIVSIFTAFLAFFTYEMTLTLPVLVVLYEVCFKKSVILRRRPKDPMGFFAALRMTIPYFALVFFYVFIRIFILGIVARTDYLGYSFYLTMLTMVKVFARYIFLLLLPLSLTTNHNLVGNFPSSMLPYDKLDPILSQSFFDLDVLLSAGLILGLIFFVVFCIRKYPIISFCIGWFLISLLPVSYIIPHGGAMAEKYLYIASFGFVLLLVVILNSFQNLVFPGLRSRNKFGMTILLLLGLFYGIVTFQRNTVWKSDISLFSDMAQKSPYNLLANYTLGVLYVQKNDLDNAQDYYKRAINTAPNFWEARYNLGNIYLKLHNIDLAKKEYEKVLELNPDFIQAKVNLDTISRHPELVSGSPSESGKMLKQVQHDKEYEKYYFDNINFKYPKDWKVEKFDGGVKTENPTRDFVVEIKLDKKSEAISAEEYVSRDKENYGLLTNEGLAKVPNMDWAYVKVWDRKLQFFLFKKDEVIKVLVYPSDSAEMKNFDTILGSISLNETQ